MFHSPWLKQLLWIVLFPAALIWAWVARGRRRWLSGKGYRSSLHVICVGNLHSGGSGKTPIVRAICERFSEKRPSVLARGYRGTLSRSGARVGAASGGPVAVGDEPWMLAQILKCPVYVGANRARMARRMEKESLCDWIIMDDGFQNFGLLKDRAIVVINAEKKMESLYCLPLGELREPLSALAAADGVVINYEKNEDLEFWLAICRHEAPSVKVFAARRRYGAILACEGGKPDADEKFFAFCGLGDPTAFKRFAVETAGALGVRCFGDHHAYTVKDCEQLTRQARSHGATALLCTEKDAYKIRNLTSLGLPLRVVTVDYEFPDEFWYFLGTESD